jgi:hypothetical protein
MNEQQEIGKDFSRKKMLIYSGITKFICAKSTRRFGVLVGGTLLVLAMYEVRISHGPSWLQIPELILAVFLIGYFPYAFVMAIRELNRQENEPDKAEDSRHGT